MRDSFGPLDDESIPKRAWTVHDVARFLCVSTRTVRALTLREGLPCFRLRSRLRFLPCDVLQWARRRGKEGR